MKAIELRAWVVGWATGVGRMEYSVDYDSHEAFFACTEHNRGKYLLSTGLKDKNGKEIYDGDVLRFWSDDHAESVERYGMHEKRWDFICEFQNGCFGYVGAIETLHHPDDMVFKPFYDYEDGETRAMNDVEVIGNIYENPELLEDK